MRALRFCALMLLCIPSMTLGDGPAPDLRPELEVTGRADEITLDPEQRLWISTAMGHLYRSSDLGRSWVEVPIESRKRGPDSWTSDKLDRVSFFTPLRGIITGYIGQGSQTVFLTEDGGSSWRPVELPISIWIYDAQLFADGRGWLVGSTGDILATEDFGESWQQRPRPFSKRNLRTARFWMTPEGHGIVTRLGDGLSLTSDGGRTWQAMETPKQQLDLENCERNSTAARATSPRFVGDTLVLRQCGRSYRRLMDGPWTELTTGGEGARSIVAYETFGDGLIAVDADLQVFKLDTALSLEPLGHQLERWPTDIATQGNVAVFFDATQKVTLLNGQDWFSSRMFGAGSATSWPIFNVDIAPDGSLWGISRFFLYRSPDHGKTWHRITELPEAALGLAIDGRGDVMLWNRRGWSTRWGLEAASLEAIPGLENLDIVGSFRRPDVWLLYGGRQWETQGRVEVARTYFGGQFAGSVDYGWVAASTDQGRHWSVIDRWSDGGPQELFLSDDHQLTLMSWLGAIRRGQLDLENGTSLETILPATEETRHTVPYVEQAFLLDFLSDHRAWVFGWTHHLGEFLFRSRDGGKTWQQAKPGSYEIRGLLRCFDGTWLGLTGDGSLRRWNGKKFRPFLDLPETAENAWVASNGHLVVQMENGNLWFLAPGEARLQPFE